MKTPFKLFKSVPGHFRFLQQLGSVISKYGSQRLKGTVLLTTI